MRDLYLVTMILHGKNYIGGADVEYLQKDGTFTESYPDAQPFSRSMAEIMVSTLKVHKPMVNWHFAYCHKLTSSLAKPFTM